MSQAATGGMWPKLFFVERSDPRATFADQPVPHWGFLTYPGPSIVASKAVLSSRWHAPKPVQVRPQVTTGDPSYTANSGRPWFL